jgi:MFS family permease
MHNPSEPIIESQSADVVKANFRNVQIDAIGVGLANAASPFLPIFLTHLNATSFQVGLLSSMPAVTGLLLALPLGRFLQRQSNIIKWFSIARLFVVGSYALTGIISFFIPQTILVNSILIIWALATLPQVVVAIAFTVVMNAVAGPNRRYELMSRRWSTMGVTTTLMVIGIGELLDKVLFPLNYQLMFIALSIGGLISYYYSSHLKLPETVPPPMAPAQSLKFQVLELKELVFKERPFLSFMAKRFIFMSGVSLSLPLIPLYLVRYVHASDQWISIITTSQIAIMVLGYFFWTRLGRRKGTRAILIWTTLGLSLYPFLLALTTSTWQIAIVAGISGIFQAGLDLVFFDELMKVVPVEYSAIFVGLAQSIQYLAAIASPLIGTWISDQFSLPVGLFVAAGLRFIGFFLFFTGKKHAKPNA